jgi:hypothetical protein
VIKELIIMAKWVRAWIDGNSVNYTNAYINLDHVRALKVVEQSPNVWILVAEYSDGTQEHLIAGTNGDLAQSSEALFNYVTDTEIL